MRCMMVGHLHDSITLLRIWDSALQWDVTFDKERNAHPSCLHGDQTDIFEPPEGRNMLRKLKRVEMDFSMAKQEPVEQVKATEVVIMTVRTRIQTPFCPTLAIVEVPLHVQVWDHVVMMKRMHHWCPEKPLSIIDISASKMTKPTEWQP